MRRIVVVVMLVLAAATGASAAPVLPDLVSDPPVHSHVEHHVSPGQPDRLLVRMDGFVHNAGQGPLDVAGNPSTNQVNQRILQSPGTSFLTGRPISLQFENSDGHNHWHMMAASEYSLWKLDRSAEVAAAAKIGFCLFDIERVETHGPVSAFYNGGGTWCAAGNPNATSLRMGISAGWRDTYGWWLELQWVDVSDTPPGEYRLAALVDPDDAVEEASESNNSRAFAAETSIVPGYVAQPVGPVEVAPATPAQVTLASSAFSRSTEPDAVPGPRRFIVTAPPQHGTLSVATGTPFAGPTVTYTPNAGYAGTDAFTYVARDANSPFPRTPQSATVSLNVGTTAQPAIALSGAPQRLTAGTTVQLAATVTNAPADVEWTVGGVVGGSTELGTISPGGLYRAPSTPPTDPVTVGVRLRAQPNVTASAFITVVPLTPPTPLPSPAPVRTGEPIPTVAVPSARPVVRRRQLVMRAVAPANGTIRLQAHQADGRLIVECVMPVRKGRTLTCSRRVAASWNLAGVVSRAEFVNPARVVPAVTRPGVAVRKGSLMVGTTARRGGNVEIVLMRGVSRLMRCVARVPAGRPVACSRRVGPAVRAAQVRAVVTHRSARGVAVTRL